jgi:hypothetical protein
MWVPEILARRFRKFWRLFIMQHAAQAVSGLFVVKSWGASSDAVFDDMEEHVCGACLQRFAELQITDKRRRPITVDSAVDHGEAYSVYFSDPYGHHLEVTTYDYEAARAELERARAEAR